LKREYIGERIIFLLFYEGIRYYDKVSQKIFGHAGKGDIAYD